MDKNNPEYEPGIHHGKSVIFIRFEYSRTLNDEIKKLPGVHWSQSQKSWYVLDTPFFRAKFGMLPNPVGKELLAHIEPINQPALHRLIETLQLKAYSHNTITTYRNEFAQLLYLLKTKTSTTWILNACAAISCIAPTR